MVEAEGILAAVERGYGIMRGYFDNEPATRAALAADGWLRTGDLGSIDELGYLHIQGRLKDMIIRSTWQQMNWRRSAGGICRPSRFRCRL
jgi:long-subunit acyl-CoA synthetase (AMP-forming)